MLADIRYDFRRLRKRPGFTLAALPTLGLGIGVNTTMFTVLNGIVLRSTCAVADLDTDQPLKAVLTTPASAKQITSGFILTGTLLGAFAATGDGYQSD